MTRFALPLASLLLLALPACASDQDGQSGTEVPDGCYERSRTEIADPSVAFPGMAYSAAEIAAEIAGTYEGTLSGESLQVELEVTAGTVWVVEKEWVTSGGTSEGMGAPEVPCDPYYEVPMIALVQRIPLLDEAFPVVVQAADPETVDLQGQIPGNDVTGSTMPTFNPNAYDSYGLSISASIRSSAMNGTISWFGENEQEESTEEQVPCEIGGGVMGCLQEDGACGACTATTGVAGIVEPVGSFSAQRN